MTSSVASLPETKTRSNKLKRIDFQELILSVAIVTSSGMSQIYAASSFTTLEAAQQHNLLLTRSPSHYFQRGYRYSLCF